MSIITATFTDWPHIDVPAPRVRTGTPASWHARMTDDDVFDRAREDNANRNLPVVRCLRGICGSRPGIEPNLRVRGLSELALQGEKLVEVGA